MVDQIWQNYQRTKTFLVLGSRMGRQRRQLTGAEVHIVKKAFATYKVSAALLEKLIERNYITHISHNKIHQILVCEGLAKKGDKKVIRKKTLIRYLTCNQSLGRRNSPCLFLKSL